jgi:DNA-binding MarR family transcriptional regulator
MISVIDRLEMTRLAHRECALADRRRSALRISPDGRTVFEGMQEARARQTEP